MSTVTDELLTYRQVARIFAVSTLTVRRWAQAGELPSLRLGAGTIRFRRSDVNAFIERAQQERAQQERAAMTAQTMPSIT